MDEEQFAVVFKGDLVPGADPAQVRANLAKLFKADAQRVEAMFAGKPVVIKKGIDDDTAQNYVAVLAKAGAVAEVVAARAKAEAAEPQPAAKAPAPLAEATPTEPASSSEVAVPPAASSEAAAPPPPLDTSMAEPGVIPTSPPN